MNELAVVALSKRLRALIAKGAHRSELLETCDLLDVAIDAPAPLATCPPDCTGCALHVAVLTNEPSAPLGDVDTEHVWPALNLLADQALQRWGRDVRIVKLFEEMGELQAELAKVVIGHKRADTARVIDEIADVFITLESVAIAFGFDAVETAIPGKLDRLARALAKDDSAPPPAPLLPAQLATPQPIEASAPVSAHPASEAPSGGAELSLPSGWNAVGDTQWVYGSRFWDVHAPRVDQRYEGFRAFTRNAARCADPWPTSRLQAMCAALGIELLFTGGWVARLNGEVLASRVSGGDDCARAALEAFHARQRVAPAPSRPSLRRLAVNLVEALDDEPPSEEEVASAVADLDIPKLASMLRAQVAAHPEIREAGEKLEATLASLPPHARQQPAPAACRYCRGPLGECACHDPDIAFQADAMLRATCKCWQLPAGGRQANRWCSLHASEWQTLAEQRSADVHEDGTPRAGCGYCASTPELDRRERGV